MEQIYFLGVTLTLIFFLITFPFKWRANDWKNKEIKPYLNDILIRYCLLCALTAFFSWIGFIILLVINSKEK